MARTRGCTGRVCQSRAAQRGVCRTCRAETTPLGGGRPARQGKRAGQSRCRQETCCLNICFRERASTNGRRNEACQARCAGLVQRPCRPGKHDASGCHRWSDIDRRIRVPNPGAGSGRRYQSVALTLHGTDHPVGSVSVSGVREPCRCGVRCRCLPGLCRCRAD